MARHSGEIIKEAIKTRGMTQTELARLIGRNQTLISRYLAGQIEISDAAARSIARVLGLDFEEIRHQLQRDRLERRKEKIGAEFKEVLPEEGKIDIPSSDEVAHIGSLVVEDSADIIAIPLLDSIPDNWDYQPKGKAESYIFAPPGLKVDQEKSFAVRISGDIAGDEFGEGDIIVVDTSTEIKDGDIALIILAGKPVLRQIYRTADSIILQSSGREKPVILSSKGHDLKIVGRLILHTRFFV